MLPVTGPSNMFTYVLADALVQWLWDIRGVVRSRATSTRSFKHVFLGVDVTIWHRWNIALSQHLYSPGVMIVYRLAR